MKKLRKGQSEGSAYWNWIYAHQRLNVDMAEGGIEIWEPIEANPDKASEPLFKQRDDDDQREDIINTSLVKEIFKVSTQREKDVIKLLQKGYNQSEIANKLKISIGSVNTLVARVRNKAVNIVYRKRKWGDVMKSRKLI